MQAETLGLEGRRDSPASAQHLLPEDRSHSPLATHSANALQGEGVKNVPPKRSTPKDWSELTGVWDGDVPPEGLRDQPGHENNPCSEVTEVTED